VNLAPAAVLALTVLAAAPSPARAPALVDGVVAVVGEQPIMMSSVVFEAEVRTVLSGGDRQVNLGPPRPDCGVLEALIDRAAVLQEAEGEIVGVDEQVNRKLEVFLDSFERVEDLTRWLGRWNIGSAELRTHLVTQIRAENFAAARARTTTLVTERDVREAYDAADPRWEGVPFDEAAEVLREQLLAEAVQQQSRAWIDAVRARQGVRYTDLGRDRLQCGGEPAGAVE